MSGAGLRTARLPGWGTGPVRRVGAATSGRICARCRWQGWLWAQRHGEVQVRPFRCRLRPGRARLARVPATAVHGVQVPGRPAGGSGLSGVALDVAELGDRLSERGKLDDQRQPVLCGLPADVRDCGQQPCGLAQAGPGTGGAGNPRVRGAGGAVEAVGSLAQHPAAEGRRRGVQSVAGCPGSIGGSVRIRGSQGSYLRRCPGGGSGGVLPDRVPFRG